MKASLRWKILGWFFVNVGVLAAGLFLFLRVQFHVGINSLLAGSTDDRLEAIARPLAGQLRQQPVSQWGATLAGAVSAWRNRGLQAALYDHGGNCLAGDARRLPPEVIDELLERDRRPAGPKPPAAARLSTSRLEKYMLVTTHPRQYWAGVFMGDLRPPAPGGPRRVALILSAESLSGGGLFFDYTPWLGLGAALALGSVLLWLPFVRGITHSLGRMTRAAEEIARGNFAAPRPERRRDELGRLARALGHMSARLEGFVTDQKRFLGDTAHELLSPLARLEVALSILEARAAPGDEAITARALEDVRQTARLVQDLLSFSKAGMREPTAALETVLLAQAVREAVRREAGEAQIAIEIEPGLRVCAAGELLARAIANGVRNAVRYAGDAGPIRIAAAATEDDVTLTISDSGPGVPEAALPRLFDPFYRPESARSRETGGVGLGLAIVKNCVEAGGGRVAVRNRRPSGLELEFTLQRAG